MLKKTAPRIILYGRHSTSMQNPKSSEDQTASCDKLVESLGGTVVATFHDPAESGYKRGRPGLKKLLAMVANDGADIVVCEALERIARDAEDVAWLAKKLGYHNVELYTATEHHVDEVKFGVAALIGTIFLKGLIGKTLRGMAAAVAAGRFAGGRAYAYKKKFVLHANGEPMAGHLEIDPAKAKVLRRIFQDFANGFSSISIATALNEEGIPGPRGGQWNASTIRGNPKALTGILNNPLYVGRLVWGRRQWRRNPDSEMRERRYRLRDRSEWIEVALPDLRIIDEELWDAVRAEMERRSISGEPKQEQSDKPQSPAGKPRKKHLLSGLIKCSSCGSNYTISGKDYYRCAGEKERGTCGNKLSVRKGALEQAAMAVLQHHLFTEEHAKIFTETFNREVAKITGTQVDRDQVGKNRLAVIEKELENLSANLLTGLVSPMVMKMLSDRETEKAELETLLARAAPAKPAAQILPHPALVQKFSQKIGALRETLNETVICTEAAELMGQLIESVTIYPDGANGPEAEVVANVADLVAYATNDNAAPKGGVLSETSSMPVVAGARNHLNLHIYEHGSANKHGAATVARFLDYLDFAPSLYQTA
ncbi:MAG: recombinase family protein, partial [Sphingobium sp.]